MDRDVLSALFVRLSATGTGLLSAVLIVNFLSLSAQGYWYTFTSILAVAAMAEMGAGQILMRFVAHEVQRISADAVESDAVLRLRNLFRFSLLWGGSVSSIVTVAAVPLGLIWMNSSGKTGDTVAWTGPWILACFASLPLILLAFLNSYFEGWQQVAVTNMRRTIVAWVTLGASAACFLFGWNIWGYGVGRGLGALVGLLLLFWMHRDLLKNYSLSRTDRIAFDWKREFLPLQGKFALTWATGIFVNGLYAPFIFRFVGADAAGKYGMSLSAVNIMAGIASSWIGARQARMAALAKRGDMDELKRVLRQVLVFSTIVFSLGAVAFAIVFFMPPAFARKYIDRMLPFLDVVLLIAASFFWLLISIFTTYVRSFNIEPFVKLAWGQALFTLVMIYPAVSFWAQQA